MFVYLNDSRASTQGAESVIDVIIANDGMAGLPSALDGITAAREVFVARGISHYRLSGSPKNILTGL